MQQGEPVALRGPGIRVRPLERSRDYAVFGFMSNDVSAEINKGIVIRAAAREMRRVRGGGGAHRGGARPRRRPLRAARRRSPRLVREGWVDAILTGNAFAVHDLEKAIVGTSLGVCQMSGRAVEGGSRNHLFAINAVNRLGGVRAGGRGAASSKSGVMYEAVPQGHPLRARRLDPRRRPAPRRRSPTPSLAQKAYVEALKGAGCCLMLASALHSIAVGNLLPARVRTICVDMIESVPVKLGNRGSMQAIGLVTDVGYFLERLRAELQ